jgi:hypothetical protein
MCPFAPSHDPTAQSACKDTIQEEEEDKTEKNELDPREKRVTISIRRSSGSSFFFFSDYRPTGKNK